MHVVADIDGDDLAFEQLASDAGIVATALSRYYADQADRAGVLLGFAAFAEREMESDAARLAAALENA